jgi:hypothetical protein
MMLALLFLFFWLGKSKPPQPSVLARHIIANANPKGLGLLQRTILQEPYVLNCNEITKMSQKKMGNNANRSQIAFFQVVEFLNFVQNWIRKNTESLAKKLTNTWVEPADFHHFPMFSCRSSSVVSSGGFLK